jgi:NAD(P)-dependent dehydrogenase (short-subunit alcohol dehydrogenase family)
VGLTRADAVTHARDGIRINALCPGFVETPLMRGVDGGDAGGVREVVDLVEAATPMGRMARVDEVAGMVVLLASGLGGYVTGAAVAVDGGYTAV